MVVADICHDASPILIVTGDDDRVVPTKDSSEVSLGNRCLDTGD